MTTTENIDRVLAAAASRLEVALLGVNMDAALVESEYIDAMLGQRRAQTELARWNAAVDERIASEV